MTELTSGQDPGADKDGARSPTASWIPATWVDLRNPLYFLSFGSANIYERSRKQDRMFRSLRKGTQATATWTCRPRWQTATCPMPATREKACGIPTLLAGARTTGWMLRRRSRSRRPLAFAPRRWMRRSGARRAAAALATMAPPVPSTSPLIRRSSSILQILEPPAESWDAKRHPDCAGDKPAGWCKQEWCYVDPCECDLDVPPKTSSYLPSGMVNGKPVYFSYATCGTSDSYSATNSRCHQGNFRGCVGLRCRSDWVLDRGSYSETDPPDGAEKKELKSYFR